MSHGEWKDVFCAHGVSGQNIEAEYYENDTRGGFIFAKGASISFAWRLIILSKGLTPTGEKNLLSRCRFLFGSGTAFFLSLQSRNAHDIYIKSVWLFVSTFGLNLFAKCQKCFLPTSKCSRRLISAFTLKRRRKRKSISLFELRPSQVLVVDENKEI